jgi:hypothetical protein
MPSFDITLSTPFSIAVRNRSWASSGDGRSPPIRSFWAREQIVCSASGVQTGSAP